MKNKKVMSESQRKVYECVRRMMAKGLNPTVREICDATGLTSTSTVHSHLRSLERMGYLSRDRGHRSIQLVGSEKAVSVPILGKVTAGVPVYAFEDVSGYIPFPSSKAAEKELFALRIAGESMRDIGIFDRDVVVCEQCSSAENGDIVVALIDDEATVKSFYKENGHFRLQPHNPDFQPLILDHLDILGKVISLYREF